MKKETKNACMMSDHSSRAKLFIEFSERSADGVEESGGSASALKDRSNFGVDVFQMLENEVVVPHSVSFSLNRCLDFLGLLVHSGFTIRYGVGGWAKSVMVKEDSLALTNEHNSQKDEYDLHPSAAGKTLKVLLLGKVGKRPDFTSHP